MHAVPMQLSNQDLDGLVDFSDHLNYYSEGFVGMMVTDTAFYRNKAYHTPQDTPDRLDYGRMAKVVDAVLAVVR